MVLSALRLALIPGCAEGWRRHALHTGSIGEADDALHIQCARNSLYLGIAFSCYSLYALSSSSRTDPLERGAFALLGVIGLGVSCMAAEDLQSQVLRVSATYSNWRAKQGK